MLQLRRFWALIVLTSVLVTGCTTSAPIDQGAGVSQPRTTTTAIAVDLSRLLAVDYRRSGGLAGVDDHAQLFRDGRVTLQRRDQPDEVFWLTPDELAQLDAAFEAADFHRSVLLEPNPPAPVPDSLLYAITRRGLLVESTLNTHDTAIPAWAQPLLALLDGLLLTPQPGRSQPAATPPGGDQTARLVLVELRLSGAPGADEQILVNLDGSYSVARQGVVTTGQLDGEQLAALLGLLEDAKLQERAAEYLPDDTCCDRMTYELVYRNLMGGYQLRAMEGAVPDWLQPILDAMTTTFLSSGPVAVAPTSALAAPTATSTRAAEGGAATPAASGTSIVAQPPTPTATVASPSATPSPTAEPTATPTSITSTPTPMPAETRPSPELAVFYGELVAQGAVVVPTGARVTKPYLSAPGTLVRINGQPVQVFEYADAALLEAELSGLAPDASSIDGRPLAWQGIPHFWRRGPVLVLWVGDDPAMLELLHSVLGEQIAGS